MWSEPQLFKLSFDGVTHSVVAVLRLQDAGLQSYSMATCALMKNAAQTWPFLKHLFCRVAPHAALFT
jgi:hypothetical protein